MAVNANWPLDQFTNDKSTFSSIFENYLESSSRIYSVRSSSVEKFVFKKSLKKNNLRTTKKTNNLIRIIAQSFLPTVIERNPS